MRIPLFLLLAIAPLACAPALSQSDETRQLRDELVRARLEVLDLKLQLARLAGKTEDESRALLDALRSDLPELGVAGLRELAKLPDDRRRAALPDVLARFPAAPEAVKVQATSFLGLLGLPEAEGVVVKASADGSPAVRKAAASALKASASAEALEALLALLRDPLPDVRIAALEALGVARREEAVAPILALATSEPDGGVQEKAIDALGAIGSAAPVEALLKLLATTGRANVRWSCINSLGQIGDPRAAPGLRPFLEGGRPADVRQVAIEALGRLRDAASLPALGAILKDDADEKLRERSAAAIGLIPGAEGAEEALLRAYFEDGSDLVRRAAWAALTGAAGDSLEANERLISALLARQKRAEADALCTRLHGMRMDEASRARALAIEEKVAGAAFDAGDARSALLHYRQILALAPERIDALRRIAACFGELKDAESRVKTLRDLEAKLPRGEALWWDARIEILSVLEAGRDAELAVDEAAALLALNPPPHPEERRRALEQSLRASTLRLIQPIAERDAIARMDALEAARRLGKKIIGVLAAEAEAAKGPMPAVVEAANAITQTQTDPATAEAPKLLEAAKRWREWGQRN